jgi:hypothetical protein
VGLLSLDAWFDEPAYKASMGTFSEPGASFWASSWSTTPPSSRTCSLICTAMSHRTPPTPPTQWQTILAFIGASEGEIADVQKRMGRVWR